MEEATIEEVDAIRFATRSVVRRIVSIETTKKNRINVVATVHPDERRVTTETIDAAVKVTSRPTHIGVTQGDVRTRLKIRVEPVRDDELERVQSRSVRRRETDVVPREDHRVRRSIAVSVERLPPDVAAAAAVEIHIGEERRDDLGEWRGEIRKRRLREAPAEGDISVRVHEAGRERITEERELKRKIDSN